MATSDHQAEAFERERPDYRDFWEREQQLTPRGAGTDFWNRYAEDIGKARDLGCKMFRFSVAWSRVERVEGEWDEEALAHYRKVVEAIRAAGMEPMVTLHHFTWPVHVHARGGLIAEAFPEWFERYAAAMARALGGAVPYWITFNEPNLLMYGHVKPWWQAKYMVPPGCPPGTPSSVQLEQAAKLMRNLFLAHARGREAIKKVNAAAKVGTNPFVLGLPPFVQALSDWLVSHRPRHESFKERHRTLAEGTPLSRGLSRFRHGHRRKAGMFPFSLLRPGLDFLTSLLRTWDVMATISTSDWWLLGIAGKLPEYLCPAECHGKQDFVGFDYYWGINFFEFHRVSQLVDASLGRFDQAPVDPPGLMRALRRYARMFPGHEILIVENGCIDRADGYTREEYLEAHVAQVREARRQGIPVTAYICWSITSNREWGLPFTPASDFGLYHIDLDRDPALERRATRSAEVFARLAHEERGGAG